MIGRGDLHDSSAEDAETVPLGTWRLTYRMKNGIYMEYNGNDCKISMIVFKVYTSLSASSSLDLKMAEVHFFPCNHFLVNSSLFHNVVHSFFYLIFLWPILLQHINFQSSFIWKGLYHISFVESHSPNLALQGFLSFLISSLLLFFSSSSFLLFSLSSLLLPQHWSINSMFGNETCLKFLTLVCAKSFPEICVWRTI